MFHEYQRIYNRSAVGATHEELVQWFCTKNDVDKLRVLYNFKFNRHSLYNLSEKRLLILEKYIQERAIALTNLLIKDHSIKNQNLESSNEQLNIHGVFLGYRYQYIGDDKLGGKCIIMNKDNQMIKDMIVTEHDLYRMDAITFIENLIEELS